MKNRTDETINTYNNVVKEYIEYFRSVVPKYSVQFQKEIDILINNLNDNNRILDAGTSIGDYPKYLTEKCSKNFEVIGIDAAENMINAAINNAPKAKFKVMDLRNLEFPDNYFNAIICFATLIHINDADTKMILNKFNSLLKPKGIIMINVMEHKKGNKEIYEKDPLNTKYWTYYNLYKKEFFIDWFTDKGYDILNIIDNGVLDENNVMEPDPDVNQFSIIVQKK